MNALPFYAIAMALLICGCSHPQHRGNHSGIIIDPKGVNMRAYHRDLHDCQQLADQVATGRKVATKAAGGAVVGGAIGAVVGDSDRAAKGAGVGAILGATKGLGQSQREKRRVVKQCLRGRGYRVLN